MKKKIIASILAMTMVVSSVSFSVLADDVLPETDPVVSDGNEEIPDVSANDIASDILDASQEIADSSNETSTVASDEEAISDDNAVSDDNVVSDDNAVSDETQSEEESLSNEEDSQEIVSENTAADSDSSASDADTSAEETTADGNISLDAEVKDGWNSGNTGGSTSAITGDLASGVTMANTTEKNGKWSNTSDEFAYFATPVDKSKDFTLSADIVVKNFGKNSPTQISAGLAIFDNVSKKTPNSVALSLYGDSNNAGFMDFAGNYRTEASARAYWGDFLSKEAMKRTQGAESEKYQLKITKRGSVYTVYCNDKFDFIVDNGDIFSGDTIYPSLYQARECTAEFTNIKLDVDDRTVSSIEITSMPNKTEYVVGNNPDFTGMAITAKYSDGTSEVLNPDGYGFTFDKTVLGPQTITFTKGDKTCTLDVNYVKNRVDKINVLSGLVKTDYFIGEKLQTKGLSLEAEFIDGSKKILEDGEYELSINGKTITEDSLIESGASSVKAVFVATDDIEQGSASANIPIKVDTSYKINSLVITSKPAVTTYYLNEEFDPIGMTVRGDFLNSSGDKKMDTLIDGEYVVDVEGKYLTKEEIKEGKKFDNTKAGTYKIIVYYAANPSIQASFDVTVKVKEVRRVRMTGYPITTYNINPSASAKDAFDITGLEVSYFYSNGELQVIKPRNIIYSSSDKQTINEDGLFDIDLTKFQVKTASSADNPTSFIYIVPVNEKFSKIELPVTVKQSEKHYWKRSIFGESTSASKCAVEGDIANIEDEGSTAHVASIGNAGKISTDQDGIAFLYTRVNINNNFRLSGDVTINDYLTTSFDDKSRQGQEAFGLMARDNIMLKDANKDSLTGITATASEAEKDADGEPVALQKGTVFCGNFVLLGGCTFTGYPTNTAAANFEKNRDLNRINLAVRYNAESWETSKVGSPTRAIPSSTMSKNMFKKGDKFRLTLEKINGGYKGTCYDYQTGTTEVRTFYPTGDQGINGEILGTIDPENIYVGFFAARRADMTVENVDFWITDPSTDLVSREENVATVTPRISITSDNFTSNTSYNLCVKATNASGGYLTIKQDDKIIQNGAFINKKNSVFPLKINADGETKFSFYYTPRIVSEDDDTYEILTSTDEISETFVVTHKSDFPTKAEKIYVSPKGKFAGKGTKEDPYDLDTAIGFVNRGQTIIMMDGIYLREDTINVPESKSGTSSKRIGLIADEGATPIIDAQRKFLGMTLAADYWDVKGIHFRHSADNQRGFQLSGSYCVIDNCKFYDNGDTGFQLSGTSSDTMKDWPHNNLVKNCEVWNSVDPGGINADGFGCKLTVGVGNKFLGCVSHHNGDDGWDLYTKSGSGRIAVVTLENCISYRQGYELHEDGTSTPRANGGHNGFKLGGEGVAVPHVVRNCIAFMNGASGFSSNSNPMLTARDCISWNNEGGNISLYSGTNLTDEKIKNEFTIDGEKSDLLKKVNKAQVYDIKGIVSYQAGKMESDKVGAYTPLDCNYLTTVIIDKDEKGNKYKKEEYSENASTDRVTDAFFKSLDREAVMTNWHFAQDADGNFITGDFLKLTSEAKAKIAYKEEETTVDETTTEPATIAIKDYTGGGSSKRSNSSKSSSSSKTDSDKTDKTDSDKTDKTDSDKTDKTDSDKTDKTDGDKTDSNNTNDNNINIGNDNKPTSPSENKAAAFTDIQNSWTKPYVEALANAGIINGINETTFAPNAKITRGDFTKILVTALGLTSNEAHGFVDVKDSDYYNNEIKAAKAFGLVKGTSNVTFGPKENITRQDAITIIARAVDSLGIPMNNTAGDLTAFSDNSAIAPYAKDSFVKLVGLGFVNGSGGKLNPTANITRGEAAKLVYDLTQIKK